MGRPTSKVDKVVVAGPLAPFADGFEARLEELGYTPLSAVTSMRLMAHLSRWLERARADGGRSERRAGRAVPPRATGGWLRPLPVAAQPGRAARGAGLAGGADPREDPPPPCSASEALLAVVPVSYLLDERALAPSTAMAYVLRARRFLAGRNPEVERRRVDRRRRHPRGAGRGRHGLGRVDAVLRGGAAGVPAVLLHPGPGARRSVRGGVDRDRSPPPGAAQGISRAEATALLGSCDRRRSMGRRDYAVLLVVLRLGLRAGEVAALTLADLDWRAGEIVVHGKGRRVDRLPLPADVGEAIAAYLRRGRPRTARREVFLRAVAPIAPLSRRGVLVDRAPRLRAGRADTGGRAPAAAHAGLRDGPRRGPAARDQPGAAPSQPGQHRHLRPGRTSISSGRWPSPGRTRRSGPMSDLDRHVQRLPADAPSVGVQAAARGPTAACSWPPTSTQAGAEHLTTELAICAGRDCPRTWRRSTGRTGSAAARGFATYLKTIDPATEIPPAGCLPARAPRPTPYLWSRPRWPRLLARGRGSCSRRCGRRPTRRCSV